MVARERRHLHEHERAFRRFTENADEGFWISDPDFRTISVNSAFEEIWGRPHEVLCGDSGAVIEAIHPEDRERVEQGITHMTETGEFDETYRVQRPDGTVRWVHDRGFPVYDSAGEFVNIAGIATDVTERRRIGAELRRNRARTERIVETSPVMLLVLGADRIITFANERAEELAGVEDVAGTPFERFPWELLGPDGGEKSDESDGPWPENREPVSSDRKPFALVRERERPVYDLQYPAWIGGTFRWLDINGAPLFDDGEFDGAVFAVEDVTDRKRRERALAALHESSREMMRADSSEAVYEVAVAAADDALALSRVACYRLEPEGYALEPAAHSAAATEFVEENDRIESGPIWEAFVEGRLIRGTGHAAIPLGSHGVFVLLNPAAESLSPVRILCNNAEAALDRTDREGVLQAQSETLRRANDELERLNVLTDLVRDVTTALVRADSREEIAATVCERLAASERYRFAWIGDETGSPTAWAGITEAALAGIAAAGSDAECEPPAARALSSADDDPVVEGDLLSGADPDRRADALSNGYRSVAAVALTHHGRTYGVLSVYADREGAFTGDEREVLSELGRTVGYAIDAVEARTALTSDGVTELRVSIDDPGALPVELAGSAELDHRGLVPRADGSISWFVAVEASLDRVRETAAEDDRIESLQELLTEGTTLVECAVRSPCLFTPFVEHGATITAVTVEGTRTVITAEATAADSRALSAALEREYDAEPIGKRTFDRPPRTREERRGEATGKLTDRQREILEIAHHSGYFETPRRITGAELAERLGVNRSTFHRTLRAAEQATFEALLE
ncbi:PAS domain S-box protein [Halalkalicoccus jeotgali]|uniref:histidine kinase n=1 Tax=Halalkalicoccus jeotgali (strain DSM 18796 / CECT 7217 / JCM 14584 / KCTC 4019 / B3) TaxID=795797 RepID=D8J9P9_HALJB|nr:PAS domain S-box protein [Halalkalicoccus jeotgali]ADJ16388.1 putative PAS/PAC sensor protein [Halalkalicoccus jeotgali B3]ELY37122.1 putative PAS/PAC sensor protein [Halalkalicoccus jeotgali B3]